MQHGGDGGGVVRQVLEQRGVLPGGRHRGRLGVELAGVLIVGAHGHFS
jgi:hypothetical protein